MIEKNLMENLTVIAKNPHIIKEITNLNMDANRLLKNVLLYIQSLESYQRNRILECTPASLKLCILECANLGIYPSKRGNVYFIPYKNICQLRIGYLGLEALALQQEDIIFIQAYLVRKGDDFKVTYGTQEGISHIPKLDSTLDITHSYAVLKRNSGQVSFEIMDIEELKKIKILANKDNKKGDSPAWKNWEGEMYKKTVLRRLLKHINYDITSKLSYAINVEDRASDLLEKEPSKETSVDILHDMIDKDNKKTEVINDLSNVQCEGMGRGSYPQAPEVIKIPTQDEQAKSESSTRLAAALSEMQEKETKSIEERYDEMNKL